VQLGQVLRYHASRSPERTALVDRCGSERSAQSYGQLDAKARSVAAALRRAGLVEGDRVALCAENGVGYVAAYFGALYAGACVLPLPVLSAPGEVAYRLRHARVRALMVDAARWPLARNALESVGVGVSLLDVGDLMNEQDATLPSDRPAGASAMLLYTSGTTGSPKAAVLSHGGLLAHTAALVHHTLRLDAHSRVLGVLPFTHSFGTRMTLLAPLYAGGCCVTLPRFDAGASLHTAEQEAVTWLPGVPSMFSAWSRVEGDPWPELEACLSAGAPLPESVQCAAEARLGAPIREGYGLTEASFCTVDDGSSPRVHGHVGRPVFGVELRIRNEAGEAAETNEVGEVEVRGTNSMLSYLDEPEATASVMHEGFLRTGDLGRLDPSGRLWIVDRRKDLILRGGYNVVPSEVEDALASLPGVVGVAVVGRPDTDLGEEIVAVFALAEGARLGPAEVGAHARLQLSRPKQPRELAYVEALPFGPSRKVLRQVLRERLISGELTTLPIPKI